jgi:alkanesulfonate monooxygenase SsuD/methylene tetrahydromethanopterin reductase-like flavin-dependent oxidoreductase (luciferase family)
VPILTAAMGAQAQRLCGEIADGVIISNLSPTAFTRHAVAIIHEAAARMNRHAPCEIVQYVPGAVRDDGGEARRVAKRAVAAMLIAYGQIASAATRAAMSEHGRPEDFARANEPPQPGRGAGGRDRRSAARGVCDRRHARRMPGAGAELRPRPA